MVTKLKSKNLSYMEKVGNIDGKGKREASKLQINLEKKFKDSKKYLIFALHKNKD